MISKKHLVIKELINYTKHLQNGLFKLLNKLEIDNKKIDFKFVQIKKKNRNIEKWTCLINKS